MNERMSMGAKRVPWPAPGRTGGLWLRAMLVCATTATIAGPGVSAAEATLAAAGSAQERGASSPAALRAALPTARQPAPAARRAPDVARYHGVAVPEPYGWLESLTAQETRDWVAAQNRFAEAHLAEPAARAAMRRLLAGLRTAPPTDSLRERVRMERFAQDSTVRLVDEFLHPSPDGRHLAYGLTRGGSEWQELRILDLQTGTDLPERIEGLRSYMWTSWTADGAGFFYPQADRSGSSPGGGDRLMYHRLGTAQAADLRIPLPAVDSTARVIRQRMTEDGRYLIVFTSLGNSTGNSLHLLDLGDPLQPNLTAPLRPLVLGADARYTVVGNRGPEFYVATTLDAPRGRIVRIDARSPARAHWRTIVPQGEATIAADFFSGQARLAGDRLVVPVRDGVQRAVRFHTLEGEAAGELPVPGVGTVGSIRVSADGSALVYTLTRFPQPVSVYRYDLASGVTTRIEAPAVPFDADAYRTEIEFVRSRDGTRVPLFVTYRAGIERDGSHPTLLLGYGGYGGTVGPAGYARDHRLLNTAWLELGGIVAVAALRGGGEYGQAWHDAGRRENKQNTFDDFIAAAEHLIRENYTRADRLAIAGNSNGGLTVAAALTQRPDLFAAALPDVGLTDMLRAHLLPGGSTGVHEFGTPDTPVGFAYLHAYSPLHNVRAATCYPATLITTGMNDENVHPSHSFKFAAALQAAQSCARPVLLWTDMAAGHGGSASPDARLDRLAGALAFLAAQLGLPTGR